MLARTDKGEEIRSYFLDCEASQMPGQAKLVTRLTELERIVS
ncbi:hypothetical protein [Spirosoma rigui]|nr:hypothetical protein [Spirosoma rigui]